MDWFLKNLKENYANFEGRARRKEFWIFILCVWLLSVIAAVALAIVGWVLGLVSSTLSGLISMLSALVPLALLIPTLAVGVRRLHDTGKPTWYIVFSFIPLLNLYYLYLMLIGGDRGSNEYGPDPKAETNGMNAFTNYPPTPSDTSSRNEGQ